jgi:hypothetical protein
VIEFVEGLSELFLVVEEPSPSPSSDIPPPSITVVAQQAGIDLQGRIHVLALLLVQANEIEGVIGEMMARKGSNEAFQVDNGEEIFSRSEEGSA